MASHKTYHSLSTRYEEVGIPKAPEGQMRPHYNQAAATSSTSRIPAYSSSIFSRPRTKKFITPNEGEERTDSASVEPAGGRGRRLQKPLVQGHDSRETALPFKGRTSDAEANPLSTKSRGLGIYAAGKSSIASSTTSELSREKSGRRVLRRKPSSINQHSEYARTESTSSSYDPVPSLPRSITSSVPGYRDPYPGSVLGITLPLGSASTTQIPGVRPAILTGMTSSSATDDITRARSLYPLSTQNLPVSTPLVTMCPSSPSTRCSESPGPFSRTSTPTSMSSHSPALILASKSGSRTRQLSPTRSRPPVTLTGRRAGALFQSEEASRLDSQGLPALRESLTSSSSGSTVKAGERGGNTDVTTKNKIPRLSPPPPSPPQRKSSKKFSQTSAGSKRSVNSPGVKSRSTTQKESETTTSSVSSPDSVIASPPNYGIRPTRPSRAGTSNLEDQYQPSPIIQSNLSQLQTSGHKRRESLDLPTSSASGRTAPMTTASSTTSSYSNLQPVARTGVRHPSPSPGSATDFPSSAWNPDRGRLPPMQLLGSSAGLSRGVSPTSAGSVKASSRFGLFSRRARTTSSDEAEAMAKKGPTAGTGHEGYGKYARRGRSGSASTSGSRARSTSASSASGSAARTPSSRKSSVTSGGEPEMDEFFRERLAPVVIGGGGAVLENRNRSFDIARTGSGQSVGTPSLESRSSTKSKTGQGFRIGGGNSSTSASSLGSTSRIRSPQPPSRLERDAESSDASERTRVSALAVRRSLHRSQILNETEPMKLPAPLKTNAVAPSPSLNSYDTSYSLMPQTDSTIPVIHDLSDGKEGLWLKPKPGKPEKSPRRWNFFQRTQRSPQRTAHSDTDPRTDTVVELPATITPRLDARPIAHYALFDATEQLDSDAVEDSPHEFEPPSVADMNRPEDHSTSYSEQPTAEEHLFSPLLPSRPVFPPDFTLDPRPCSPKVMLRSQGTSSPQQAVATVPQPARPSRLPQVGRIPRVISKRDRSHHPPVQSFSRPFAQQPRPVYRPVQAPENSNVEMHSDYMPLQIQTDLIPTRQWDGLQNANPASAPEFNVGGKDTVQELIDTNQFLAFPPRKGSEVSGSSSSGVISFADTTAILPRPDAALSEDEVWNEYDDLIDNVMSPNAAKTPLSTTSSLGVPFQYADLPTTAQQHQVQQQRKMSPVHEAAARLSSATAVHHAKGALAASSEVLDSGHGSRLVSPLPSTALPSTPMSFTEFFTSYEERNNSNDQASTKHSSPSRSQSSSDSAKANALSRVGPSPSDMAYHRNTQLMNFAEKERDGPVAQTNLRFGALMTSRWLSFGRVLFSPAHTEIKNNRQDRILILDGLGNDDWSFYCALTYPDATVYNLSPYQPSEQASPRKREPGAWSPPANHRQIHHTSIAHPFPFPKGFFTAVIVRFPVANSEAAYRNAISECKRILRPGGYLEISVLDLDMMNMGNRARRAVRMLKVRMQVADSEVSLKPVSDNIQKMLGRRGFENLNRCTVGVPVAGKVSDSRSGSFDEKNLSLGDMLKDQSEEGDEGITKMVAKVGRWWYTRCYELGVLPNADLDRSIWNDKALLKECEKRETSFKLLICYAQKPLAPRRRTVSV